MTAMIPAPSPAPARAGRLAAVDALRGLVMIIMALDHVRDFVHRGAMSQSPTDLATTTPLLFMTRWITHFCAPVFMLTAGMGAYFYWKNGNRTRAQLSRFLVTRGLWLIALELTIMQLAYNFDVSANYPIFLLVLWVLGACMIVLAGLVWMPIRVLTVLSVATIILHNSFDGIRAQSLGGFAPFWTLLHQVGAIPVAGRIVIAPYTLVPWFAVMALGFCIAQVFSIRFSSEAEKRRDLLFRLGLAMTIAFVALRVINVYGDPARWQGQSSTILTLLSFLNTTKYPPSLAFLLMTLGPALMVLSWFDRVPFARSNPLIVFGRVPLFYFVLHFVLAHAAIVVLALFTYGSRALTFMFQPVPSMGGPAKAFPPDFGYDLWVAYAVWITIVVGLYPLCRWFAAVKERGQHWWLSYL
jgi:uncharacterized membrane protein